MVGSVVNWTGHAPSSRQEYGLSGASFSDFLAGTPNRYVKYWFLLFVKTHCS